MEKLKEEYFGEYRVVTKPNGRRTVYCPKGNCLSLPPDQEIIARYKREKENGKLTGTTRQYIYRSGILTCGSPSTAEGAKRLGISMRKVTFAEIEKAIKTFWPEGFYKKAIKGEIEIGPEFRIGEFRRRHERSYISAGRSFGGFRKVLEKVYPKLYAIVHPAENLYEDLNREDIKQRLLERFYSGKPINKRALKDSTEETDKNLFRKVIIILSRENTEEGLLPRRSNKKSWAKTVAKLTGLEPSDIIAEENSFMKTFNVAERLTEFLFSWAPLFGETFNKIVQTPETVFWKKEKERKFLYSENKEGISDLRIGNIAGEVKTGSSHYQFLESFLEKYSPGKNKWADGEEIKSSFFAFYSDAVDKRVITELEKAGIYVFLQQDLQNLLEKTILKMQEEYGEQISQLYPRIHNLESIIKIHDEICFRPKMISHKFNKRKRKYILKVLNELINLADKIRSEKNELGRNQ